MIFDPAILATLVPVIITGIYYLGDDKKYKQLKKGAKRFKDILRPIVEHPAYSRLFLYLNLLLGALGMVYGALTWALALIKYGPVAAYITMVLVWAASINIIYRSIVLYKTIKKAYA